MDSLPSSSEVICLRSRRSRRKKSPSLQPLACAGKLEVSRTRNSEDWGNWSKALLRGGADVGVVDSPKDLPEPLTISPLNPC